MTMTLAEIADELGITVRDVSTIIKVSLDKLKHQMRNQNLELDDFLIDANGARGLLIDIDGLDDSE